MFLPQPEKESARTGNFCGSYFEFENWLLSANKEKEFRQLFGRQSLGPHIFRKLSFFSSYPVFGFFVFELSTAKKQRLLEKLLNDL